MRVVVTGASGFIGKALVTELLRRGHEVTGLARGPAPYAADGLRWVQGDVVTGAGLSPAMAGAGAVAHLVGIIRERRGASFQAVHVEGTRNVLVAATASGVRRLVHMSALGAGPSASRYLSSKGEAEELVRAWPGQWTIMRPSLVFGPGDAFFGGTLRQLVTLPPLIPVVGKGDQPFRPVWLDDVVAAFVAALERSAGSLAAYELVGPREYTFRELLMAVRGALGVKRPLVNVPVRLMWLAVALFRLLPNPPITRDQLLMLLAGNTSDPGPAAAAFGLTLGALEAHLQEVLAA